ncbi:MAG TPA: class I SAM-dependent methyltransferase [Pyrinomonadaceae bacterium]|nr:class I SAM-dependent methyltransferase [Pyrinomonadaceae bacterium]
MTSERIEYVGKDLEAMSFADSYHRWILDLMRPYVGRSMVEVGAGTGSFSELLLTLKPDSLAMVEPSEMFTELKANISSRAGLPTVTFHNNIFSNVAADIAEAGPPDSISYINVLEHIEDDLAELRIVHRTLKPGGHIIVFVPALPMLFSKFDQSIGHFRRYRKGELSSRLEEAGFRIKDLRWFDMLGILPWLVKYRIAGSTSMEPAAVHLYDRVAVPVIKRAESLISPPVGKNLFAVAEKI